MNGITQLGAGNGASINTLKGYEYQLQRSMLVPLRSVEPGMIVTMLLVVTHVGPVKDSLGTDFMLPLKVTDPTLEQGDSVPLSIYRATKEQLPAICDPGDIVYFQTMKTGKLNMDTCIYSNYLSSWQIHPLAAPVDGLHPLLRFLRHWWRLGGVALTSPQKAVAPYTGSVTGPGIGAAANSTSAAPGSAAKKVLPTGAASRFNTRYLKNICDLSPGMFGDLLLEVVHVDPNWQNAERYGPMRLECIVTDYTKHSLIPFDCELPSVCAGFDRQRLAWCTVRSPDKINQMPRLVAGKRYWMRNTRLDARGVCSGETVVVSPHVQYPRTIMVVEVEDDRPELETLLARREEMLRELGSRGQHPEPQTRPVAAMPPAPPELQGTTTTTTMGCVPWALAITPTPVASIYTSQRLNARFYVRARVTGVFPEMAAQSIVSICTICKMRLGASPRPAECPGCRQRSPVSRNECQFVLELDDGATKCLAMCPDSQTTGRLAGRSILGLGPSEASSKLREMWAWIRNCGDVEWVDFLVAPMLVPGPGPRAGALVQCLVLADVAKPLPSALA